MWLECICCSRKKHRETPTCSQYDRGARSWVQAPALETQWIAMNRAVQGAMRAVKDHPGEPQPLEGNSHMDVVGWLTQEARHILMQAGLAGGWKASSFSGPHRMLDDDREYAITMYYVRI